MREATMENFTRLLIILELALICTVPAVPVHAQAARTSVSALGDDVNPCTRTLPCKIFAGAISKTAPGGEIDVLDPGGFGAVTITKAITIDGGGGQVASILVSGTSGIIVEAGANDVVTLRNLRLNGIGTGISGIRFLSGASLIIENCDIFGFITALGAATAGIAIAPNASARVLVSRSSLTNNSNGIVVDGANGGAGAIINVTVTETSASHNVADGILAFSTADHSLIEMVLDRIVASNNRSAGIQANGANVAIILGGSTIAGNLIGISSVNGGFFASYKTNQINFNGTDGTPLTQINLN
jgi:hypothetical protein